MSADAEQVASAPVADFAVTLYVVELEPRCAGVCGTQRTTWDDAAKVRLVSPSNAGACGAELRDTDATDDGLPTLVDEPFFVIALTRKYDAVPAESPDDTTADVEADLVFATKDFQVVLFGLTSIL